MFERGFFYNKLFPHIWYTCELCVASHVFPPVDLQGVDPPFRHSTHHHHHHHPLPSASHPIPPCLSLNQGWHHHGGTQGPPHLLPITASQTPPRKRLQAVMKPEEEQPETSRKHTGWWGSPPAGSGEVWIARAIIWWRSASIWGISGA